MPAAALIRFTQGDVGADGEAFLGVLTDTVSVENADNSGVESWRIELVYVPYGSAIPVTVLAQGPGDGTPFATFAPDARGSYRLVLSVWDMPGYVGTPSVDIRVFAIPQPARGFIQPPAQMIPAPLPSMESGRPGARPNELNFGGQPFGWAGNVPVLLNEIIRITDGDGAGGSLPPLTQTVYVDAGTAVPAESQDGSIAKPYSTLQAALDAAPAGDYAHLNLLVAPGVYGDAVIDRFQRAYVSISATVPGLFLEASDIASDQVYVTLEGAVSVTGTEGGGYLTLQDVRTQSPASITATVLGLIRSRVTESTDVASLTLYDQHSQAVGLVGPVALHMTDIAHEDFWNESDTVVDFNPFPANYRFTGLLSVSVYIMVITPADTGTVDLVLEWNDGTGDRQLEVATDLDVTGGGPGYAQATIAVRAGFSALTYSVVPDGVTGSFTYTVAFGAKYLYQP